MISFGERNWHGIVRGLGYVRVLAGRARSDMLRLTPRLTQPLTPRQNFCTTHFLFENWSLGDFETGSDLYGGDLHENGHFPHKQAFRVDDFSKWGRCDVKYRFSQKESWLALVFTNSLWGRCDVIDRFSQYENWARIIIPLWGLCDAK